MSEWTPRRDGPWVALDVGLARHRKVRGLTPAAFRLYIASICHCGDELTDGLLEANVLRIIAAEAGIQRPSSAVRALEAAELWLPLKTGGWEVAGYLNWNPSRAWWERRRERERLKKQEQRARARTRDNPEITRRSLGDSQPKPNENERRSQQAKRDEHTAREQLSPRDNPGDVPQGVVDRDETRQKREAIAPKGTGSREPVPSPVEPGPLADLLRLELERLAGPDGVPV